MKYDEIKYYRVNLKEDNERDARQKWLDLCKRGSVTAPKKDDKGTYYVLVPDGRFASEISNKS
jgi:hypothetical protein